ncbi:hypothetical protein TB2_031364 [Malus domestica]
MRMEPTWLQKGYNQQYEVHYAEVFVPLARLDTVCVILSLAAQNDWTVYQLDVKSVFLHGELNEEVFVAQLSSYEQKGQEHKV